jgi:HAD superfamily hydrolase (TIGR01509 family)
VIGAVLFDVDGTLIDSNDLHAAAWRETFLHFGVDLPLKEIRGQIGKGGDNLMPALLPEELVEQRQDEMDEYRSDLFKREYLPRAVPFPGVRALFERIVADGKKIVLASSAKGAEVEYHMGVIGARDLITDTTSADDVEHSKPCPDIFAAAMEKVSPLTAEQVLVVGDTPYDVRAAKKLGIRVIGFRSGGLPEENLTEAGADEIYDGPEHLLRSYEDSLLSRA